MPPTPKSHAETSSIRRCTDVVDYIDATGVHLATAGNRCALHLFTRRGTVVVRMELATFVESCRAPVDGNGHTIPTLTALRARDPIRQLIADAAVTRCKQDAAAAGRQGGAQ